MKLLIRDYVASLKEREELDAILPDLLSELGFNVFSRPSRGTAQRGVDVAAIGRDTKGKQKLYLFSVKPGDLTRQEWDGTPQKLRASINEIIDEYIPNRIPAAHRKLKIVIVLCFGGDVHESVRSLLTAYTKQHTTTRITFEEWNGDKIAELILSGVLREELLPKPLRSSFQKAVAMVDEPEIAYEHFERLVTVLRSESKAERDTLRAARQMYICLWVLFMWARETDNLDAPYRASERVLLNLWHMMKPFIGKKTARAKAMFDVLRHVINLQFRISVLLLNGKILPHVERRNALSVAVSSRAPVDVNLKLFDMLGRLAMTGHWIVWYASLNGPISPQVENQVSNLVKAGMQMISNNPALFLPIQDQQSIEVAIFLMLAAHTRTFHSDIRAWLREMAERLDIAVRSHGRYPCRFTDYQDLIEHPKDRSDEYRKDATAGSVLIPVLAAWLAALRDRASLERLVALRRDALADCTLQLWLPETESEDHLYLNDDGHGAAITDLPLTADGSELLETIADVCNGNDAFDKLSANRTGYWPVVLTACRHYRLPVPPQFWISALLPPPSAESEVRRST